ncbi:hypothetical protein KY361_00800 [Candidatus Woesearchaeota archaeon]|nr:hypothetical protein [Candidatus Woesearchaeota archaeon]
MPELRYVEVKYRSSDGKVPEAVAEILIQHIGNIPPGHRVGGEMGTYRTMFPLYEPDAKEVAEACEGLDGVVGIEVKKEKDVSERERWEAIIGTADLRSQRPPEK